MNSFLGVINGHKGRGCEVMRPWKIVQLPVNSFIKTVRKAVHTHISQKSGTAFI